LAWTFGGDLAIERVGLRQATLQITRDDRRIVADEADLPRLAIVRVRSDDGAPEGLEADINGRCFGLRPDPQSPRRPACGDVISNLPGFKAYYVIKASDDTLATVSVFADKEAAVLSNQRLRLGILGLAIDSRQRHAAEADRRDRQAILAKLAIRNVRHSSSNLFDIGPRLSVGIRAPQKHCAH